MSDGKSLKIITNEQRYNRRRRIADFEAHATESFKGIVGEIPEMLLTLGLGNHDIYSLECGSGAGRSDAGCEDVATAVVAQEVGYFLVRGNKTTETGKALGERAHNQVYILCQAKMVDRAAATFAKDAYAVRLINHDAGIILLGQAHDFRYIGHIAFHGKHTVSNDEFHLVGFAALQLLLQRCHVIVLVLELLRK
ncbi:uncharacterized protein BN799_00704 [Prevotella sp. CAG:873]|nr:uncharacterized protein BN799_00704 [Prevotella sp. CAG:873]